MPNLEPSFINILYEWPEICGQIGLCSFMFSFTTSSKLIIFVSFYSIYLITSFKLTRSLFVPYAYVSIKSIDCILLLSLGFNVILLISLVETWHFWHLSLYCVFNIDLLFLMSCLWFFKSICVNFIFFCR